MKKIISLMICMASMSVNASEVGLATLKNEIKTEVIKNQDVPLPITIKYSFDVANDKGFFNVLRFIDMNIEAGVSNEAMDIAVVVHGNAALDLVKGKSSKRVKQLINSGVVNIYVCGQTLAKREIEKEDLLPEIKLSLSAMNAHHYLQKEGYGLNPF